MLGPVEVPTIRREQMLEAIRALGIDPAEVRSLSIHRHYVEVVQMVRNEDGHHVSTGQEVATAVVQIPIIDNMFEANIPAFAGDGTQVIVPGGVD